MGHRKHPSIASLGLWCASAAFGLVGGSGVSAATVESAGSGRWSAPGTWASGTVPGSGDDVRILAGHTVLYDVDSPAVLESVLIHGVLTFEPNVDTRLEVGVVVVSPDPQFDMAAPCAHGMHEPVSSTNSALEIGTPSRPIDAEVRAVVRLHARPGADPTCAPALLSHGGRIDLHGAPVAPTWTKLASTAPAGGDLLVLDQPVGWKAGDRVLVVATFRHSARTADATIANGMNVPESELRLVTAVSSDGRTITLDEPLQYPHLGSPDPAAERGEVANLTRNVVIESAEWEGPARGHTMYMRGSSGSISFAEFRGLGKAGVLGRYPIHFHLAKDTMRGSYVRGASIWNSDNRWIAIHGSEYVVVRDTVAFQAQGHGFLLEDGSETYNLFDRTLGVQARVADPIPGQMLAYDDNHGACFWAANARNFVFGSAFAECDNDDSFSFKYAPGREPMPVEVLQPDGTRQVVDARRWSGGLVRDLEVHSNWGWGPWISGGIYPEDEPLEFRNTRVWHNQYPIDISADHVVFDGVRMSHSEYGFYNRFAGPHRVRNVFAEDIHPHGVFMTYLGGSGISLYEDVRTRSSGLLFRIDAKSEIGASGQPIELHARRVTIEDPWFIGRGGTVQTAWVGTEDGNARPDPLLMLVLHDLFGPESGAYFLPQAQSTSQPGVPAGLEFVPAAGVEDGNGVLLQGRGAVQYAEGTESWPTVPLDSPVDRVPPATVILSPPRNARVEIGGGALTVCGVALDQFGIAEVTVNGRLATVDPNGVDWCATLDDLDPGPLRIVARATDGSGWVERSPHALEVEICVDSVCRCADDDGDGVCTSRDNCPDVANPPADCDAVPESPDAQCDTDGDAVGDPCDACPALADADPTDADGDGMGDACDPDLDGDGEPNESDPDADADGIPQDDGDGLPDPCTDLAGPECDDNCPWRPNADQRDFDGDGMGDACDVDDGRIDGLRMSRSPRNPGASSRDTVLRWTAERDAIGYDVACRVLGEAEGERLATGVPSSSLTVSDDPPPGSGYAYVVTVAGSAGD